MPTLTRVLIILCIAIAALLAWRSYGAAARAMIANSYPQLDWLAPEGAPIAHGANGLAAQAGTSPDERRLDAMSLDLNMVRENVDRIAITQERMTRSVDRLTAVQEQITREINKLQAIGQQILRKDSERLPRPAPASAHKSLPRSAQAPTAR